MAANVAVKYDEAGNMKPNKAKSSGKIDGIVCAIMALGRAMVQEEPGESIYETQGITFV
jgi:phage terminase large subunit-like protein